MKETDATDEVNRTASASERPTVSEARESGVSEARESRKTRRWVLGRASALGVLPFSGFVKRGRTESTDATAPPDRDRVASTASSPSVTFETSFDVAAEFECTYQDLVSEDVRALVETDDGGFVLIGGNWLIRTDSRGSPLFVRTYDTTAGATDIVTDDDGGFVLLRSSSEGCWLHTVDGDGETRWLREYPDDSECRSLIRTAAGGYAWVTGRTAHVVDEQGETVWRRSYTTDVRFSWTPETPGSPGLSAVVQLDDGGFALVGRVVAPQLQEEAPVWVVRTDGDGEKLDDALYGAASSTAFGRWRYHFVSDAVQTADGGVAVTGFVGDNPALTTSPSTSFLFLVVGSDLEPRSEGLTLGEGQSVGCEYVAGNALVRTDDDGFVLAGQGAACEIDEPDRDTARLVRPDLEGTVQWTYHYPEDFSRGTVARDVIQTADGGIVAVGGRRDVWLLKLAAEDSA